jgi:ribonuclease HII
MSQNLEYLVGIDEAGRGPLAGPVAVGMVKTPVDFDWNLISGVGDSKKVTPKNREAIFRRAKELKKEGKLDFTVIMGSAKDIDEKGIAIVIKNAIEKGLKKLKVKPEECFVKLDGALRAPSEFEQETIIKGDSKELVIGLASICAKVTRDEYMNKQSIIYPEYGFLQHKGYGTQMHREAIAKFGHSPEHRRTYCKNIKIQ